MSGNILLMLVLRFLLGKTVSTMDISKETTNIALVHDSWYTPGTDEYNTVMMQLVLEELTAILPGVQFIEVPMTSHSQSDLFSSINEVDKPSGIVVLGNCPVQKAMLKYKPYSNVSDETTPTAPLPFLFVSQAICRDAEQHESNTIIINEVKFQNRFNCLAWVMSEWLKTFFRAESVHLNSRANLNISHGTKETFTATDLMYECSGTDFDKSVFKAKHRLRGRTLNIVTIHRPPFVLLEVNEAGKVIKQSGVNIKMLDHLSEKLGFRYTLVLPYDGQWGSKMDNGTWNGMVGMVHRNEVDMGVASFTISLVREEAIDFTFPFYFEPTGILTPKPRSSLKVLAFLDPFSLEVWLSLLLTVAILGPVMNVLARAQKNVYVHPFGKSRSQRQVAVLGYYWLLCIALLQQGVKYPMTNASRVVFGAWITAAIIFSCYYTGVLVSFLTVSELNNNIKSIYDLPYQRDYKWTFKRMSALHSLFKDSDNAEIYKLIGEPFKYDTSDLVPNDPEGVAKVLQGTHVYIREKSFLQYTLSAEYLKTGECNLEIAKGEFFPAGFGWILPNGDPIQKLFSKEFMLMAQTGLMKKWKLEHWPAPNKCFSEVQKWFMQPLSMVYLTGPFVILSSSLLLGPAFLILEIFFKKKFQRPQKIPQGSSEDLYVTPVTPTKTSRHISGDNEQPPENCLDQSIAYMENYRETSPVENLGQRYRRRTITASISI